MSDQTPTDAPAPGWFRETPEALAWLAYERHVLAVAEATYGLDKRQARRVRRRMGRAIYPGGNQ
jgi:hypothetical protein